MIKYYNWQDEIDENELNEIVNILKNNGVVIFPTETVYGIGCNAFSKMAIDRVYKAKQRPRDKAVNILVLSVNEISKYANITSDLEKQIIEKYMPGPITLILKKKNNFGLYFTGNNDTIGIRIPDNLIILEILKRIDFPLIAPSANISDKPSGVNPKDIMQDFKYTADAIIDGGISLIGLASTIVKVENNQIKILRQGSIKID
ncbi:MAG: threonylcarbamoyl-AMP synthase [Bacilli bacterium]|nr:threonylcarbamoyl-AMP synthase [Bacilli bacterium]